MTIIENLLKRLFNGKEKIVDRDIDNRRFSNMVEHIDDIGLSEIFIRGITPELKSIRPKYENGYPLQTKVSIETTVKLVKNFFESIDPELYKWVCDIESGKNQYVKLDRNYGGHNSRVSNPNKLPVIVSIAIYGDLRQVYEAIHEITHTFDINNGDTPTRRILGEVAPQCMERLFDDFLHNLSDEEMKDYGFDRYTIEQDIKDRKISTFFDRLRSVEAVYANEYDEKYLRYMLAQIYSTHLSVFDKEERMTRLKAFIKHVENDDFDGANSDLGIQINKENKLQRDNYVMDTISAVNTLVRPEHISDIDSREEIETEELNK